jgi:dGTP triphosphohydrolase
MLRAARDKKKWSLFPLEYQEELDSAGGSSQVATRIVTDFVGGMTEKEIQSLYHALRGRA